MAPSGFDMFLISITHYVFHFFKLSGVSVNLSIGVVVTVGILLLVALLVTCLVTWRQKTEKLMAMVRHSGWQNKMRRGTHPTQPYSANIKSLETPKMTCKVKKKGLSNSVSNLNNAVNTSTSSSKSWGKKMSKKMSASCSALDLPLPREPKANKKTAKVNNTEKSLYDNDSEPNLNIKQNVAYVSNEEKVGRKSVAAMVEKINTGQEQKHEYEQLDLVQSAMF